MHQIESQLSVTEYLRELGGCCSLRYPFFSEGVTGFVLGPFFCVAYYSPYEWNRRISHECNRAWGYVKEVDGKTHVHFIRGKGLLTPFWFLLISLLCYLVFLICLDFDFSIAAHPMMFLMAFGIALFTCLTTAFASWVTEAGMAGEGEITRMLTDPKDYYC